MVVAGFTVMVWVREAVAPALPVWPSESVTVSVTVNVPLPSVGTLAVLALVGW